MKDLKHTQGNWNISKHGNNDSFGIYAEGSGNDLAIIKGGNEEGGEAEANSKLIAAAPDLLNACIEFIKEETENGLYGPQFPLIIKIKEAINKATI